MNVFDHLKKDHNIVQDILTKLSKTTSRAVKTRESLYNEFKRAFIKHSQFEEAELYPRLKEKSETHALSLEALQEHHIAKMLIKEIDRLPYEDENWLAKVTVLMENIDHHIKEEEKEMFPPAKRLLDKEVIKALTDLCSDKGIENSEIIPENKSEGIQ